MLADARLIAAKDLRIEWRSKVGIGQMVPFAVLVLVLFAFALDADRGLLVRTTAGLYWIAVLFSSLLATQRSFGAEAAPGVREAMRMSGLDPAGYFLGKASAIFVQLIALEIVLGFGVVVLYSAALDGPLLLLATCLAASVGIAAASSLYGVLAAGLRVSATLVPLLLLPVLAPVLLGATRASEAALGIEANSGVGSGWSWCGLLAVFAVFYVIAGVSSYGTLLEET